jgi:molybdopterin-guanine dinucleotide biosynthesis protein A
MGRRFSAAILAGGSGSRFNGIVKPKIIIGGETIIARILSAMSKIFDEIIIVTNAPSEFEEFGFCKIVCDEIPGSGPLGGIHAALKASSSNAVFVFAGDMPFPDRHIILKMAEGYENYACDALVPRIDGYSEPLHSVYSTSLVNAMEEYLSGGGRIAVVEFLKTVNVSYYDIENSAENLKAFTNINSPEDIIIAEQMLTRSRFNHP